MGTVANTNETLLTKVAAYYPSLVLFSPGFSAALLEKSLAS